MYQILTTSKQIHDEYERWEKKDAKVPSSDLHLSGGGGIPLLSRKTIFTRGSHGTCEKPDR